MVEIVVAATNNALGNSGMRVFRGQYTYFRHSRRTALRSLIERGQAYRNLDHARGDISAFIETIYNRQRLHSAFDYRSPMEFEQGTLTPPPARQQAPVLNTNCP